MPHDIWHKDGRLLLQSMPGCCWRMTNVPATFTYANIIMHETVFITLMLAALNLEVMAADIMNAYIKALCKEKIWTLGSEFGKDKWKKAKIDRALYGLKSAGQAFQEHLADCMHSLWYKSALLTMTHGTKPTPKKGIMATLILPICTCQFV